MKFEPLNLAKFAPMAIQNPHKVLGGVMADTEAPNGGCTCPTEGGTKKDDYGNIIFTYSGDTAAYDPNGTHIMSDYQGAVYPE